MFTVYSTKCPKCNVLLKKLELKGKKVGVDFALVEDHDELMAVANERKISSAPFLIDGDDKVYLFNDALKFVNELV